jgi:lipopolysaccharide/colanic/teichoic acid biosynthesis glycosyltransferase
MSRLFDILISGLALCFFLPFLILIVIILRFTGEGEVLFLQTRIGKNREPFRVYKFATMIKNSEKIGSKTLTMENDSRVLPFGKFLRKTKINELPQLFNIFIGDMSIIGPRPLVPEGEANYDIDISKKIRSISPGATGIGSLVLRDEESYYAHREDAHDFYKNVISPYKGSLELWYLENKSFYINLKIILFTIIAIIKPDFNSLAYFNKIPKMPNAMILSKTNMKDDDI